MCIHIHIIFVYIYIHITIILYMYIILSSNHPQIIKSSNRQLPKIIRNVCNCWRLHRLTPSTSTANLCHDGHRQACGLASADMGMVQNSWFSYPQNGLLCMFICSSYGKINKKNIDFECQSQPQFGWQGCFTMVLTV